MKSGCQKTIVRLAVFAIVALFIATNDSAVVEEVRAHIIGAFFALLLLLVFIQHGK